MNKRITSLLLSFVMVFAMLAAPVPVSAETGKSTYFKMTADKEEAAPGDIISYTVFIGPVNGLAAIKFKLKFPEGLTYVDGSGKAVEGLQTLMDSPKAEFTEQTKVFIVGSSNYTGTSDTALMTFQCKVKDGAAGNQTVAIYIDDPDSVFDQDYDNINFTITNATVVTVENEPCMHADKSTVPAKASTCADKGWDAYEKCNDCDAVLTADGQIPFRALAAHSYTAETKKAEALKTAGTCRDEAVYYYSCSECGTVEHNDSHTFNGDRDASNHTGGTYLKNQKKATTKEEGYTGDTYCYGCNAKLADGTVIAKAAEIKVSKIRITGISKQIAAGKKVKLTAAVTPSTAKNRAVSWKTSNKKYATVTTKGVVTVKKAGIGRTVTITATAKDGSNKKATFKIKIMKNAVKSITLKAKTTKVKAGKKVTIQAAVSPSKSLNKKLTWKTSNKKYATVNSKGVVTTKKAGKGRTVTITAAATDGSGKKKSIKIKITK